MSVSQAFTRQRQNFNEDGSDYLDSEGLGFDVSVRPLWAKNQNPDKYIIINAYAGQSEDFTPEFYAIINDLPKGEYLLTTRDVALDGLKSRWSPDVLLTAESENPLPPNISINGGAVIPATITINNITVDDVLNAAESAANINVTGSVGGSADVGDLISMTVNNVLYTDLVLVGNVYSVSVAGSDLAIDTSFDITVTGVDVNGNNFVASVTSTHTVDLTATATITIDDITADNIINSVESGGNVNVTGTVGGDASIGDTVSATVNGNFYNDVVTTGNVFSLPISGADLAAQTSITVSVDGSDSVGNPFSQSFTKNYTVDITASASITVNAIATDNVINRNESITSLPISGTVGGDASPGDTVSFTLNGTLYSTTVLADDTYLFNSVSNADLTFGKTFVTDPALVESHSIVITVTGTDSVGNTFATPRAAFYSLNYLLPETPLVAINAVTPDNNVETGEASGNINITGLVTGADVSIGQVVDVVVNGNTFSGAVLADNTFSIPVTGSDLLAQNSLDVNTTSTNLPGNAAGSSVTHAYTVNSSNLLAAPTIVLDTDAPPLTSDSALLTATGAVFALSNNLTELRYYNALNGSLLKSLILHPHGYVVPKRPRLVDLAPETPYTVYAKVFDGIQESIASNTVNFTTPVKEYEGFTDVSLDYFLERYLKNETVNYGTNLKVGIINYVNVPGWFEGGGAPAAAQLLVQDSFYSDIGIPKYETTLSNNWVFVDGSWTHPQVSLPVNVTGDNTEQNASGENIFGHYIATDHAFPELLGFKYKAEFINEYDALYALTPSIDISALAQSLGNTTTEGKQYIGDLLFNNGINVTRNTELTFGLYANTSLNDSSVLADIIQPVTTGGYIPQTNLANTAWSIAGGKSSAPLFLIGSATSGILGIYGFYITDGGKLLHYQPLANAPLDIAAGDNFEIDLTNTND